MIADVSGRELQSFSGNIYEGLERSRAASERTTDRAHPLGEGDQIISGERSQLGPTA
jgi:hypothetical protein